jgi:hypothetical protein
VAKKVKEGSRTYKKRAIEVASDFCPELYPCSKCGNPIPDGYVCRWCGYDNSDEDLIIVMSLWEIFEHY